MKFAPQPAAPARPGRAKVAKGTGCEGADVGKDVFGEPLRLLLRNLPVGVWAF